MKAALSGGVFNGYHDTLAEDLERRGVVGR